MGIYRMLSDHYVNGNMLEAGTTQNDNVGGLLPSGFVPTVGMDPQDQDAINKFWFAGPLALAANSAYLALGIIGKVAAKPLIYWVPVSGASGDELYILTGNGASLGSRSSIGKVS